ncbi:MAG: glycyl-radical enzyme activating protein [Lentisphaerae bacterium]|nr:glycyl-radical enzyme activating protein [Lentisphaerota bacterium]
MLKGNIIDIKHLAVHDGPGIRTTVFFKGCPLRCWWCHNPESQAVKKELGLLRNRCINCRLCSNVCRLHTFDSEGKHLVERAGCSSCGKCVDVCPVNALELYGHSISLEKTVAEVLKDRVFYGSNGGCTLSGGEPLLQSEFAAAVLNELKKLHIHTAVDTCGAVPWSSFEKVLPVTDMFLFDLKHPDPEEHRRMTGVDNKLLLENLQQLDSCGKPIEIRIPLIPQYNSTPEDLNGFLLIMASLKNLTAVKILPFHHARFKYQALDIAEPLAGLETCSDELYRQVQDFFRKNNISVSE